MPDLPDFPSWVAEAEKWERAIRKDEREKVAEIVSKMAREASDPLDQHALNDAATAITTLLPSPEAE